MKPTLEYVEHLARQAGAILRAGYDTEHQVDYKGVIDLVTEVDHQSEAFLDGQPGMLATKAQAVTQVASPFGAVDVLIKLAVQITLYAVLFQPANRTARFAASFQQFVDNRVSQSFSILSFGY